MASLRRIFVYLLSALTGLSFFLVFYVDLTFKERNDLQIPPETPHWLPSDPNPRVEFLRAPPRSRSKSLVERVVESIVPAEELMVHRTLDVFLEEEGETLVPTQDFFEGAETSAQAVHQESPEVFMPEKTNDHPQTATAEKTEKHSQQQQPAADYKKKLPSKATVATTERRPEDSNNSNNNPLFVVLGDSRSGAEWLTSVLNQHPAACAPGHDYPVGALMPSGFAWLDDASPEKGCTYAFVRDQVRNLVSSDEEKKRCAVEYRESKEGQKKDPLQSNLPRVCQFLDGLQGNYSEEAVLGLWMDLFTGKKDEPQSKNVLGCACPAESQVRGLKVLSDWIEQIPPLQTNKVMAGAKVIRLHRKNLWARYMSVVLAEKSNIWNVASAADRDRRLEAIKENFPVSLDDMMEHFGYMQELDRKADRWAQAHDETLWLEYEECLADIAACFGRIYDFLGVDPSHIAQHANLYTSSVPSSNNDRLLEHVSNADQVREALGANDMGEFIGMSHYAEIQHLIYEPAPGSGLVRTADHRPGVNTTLVHRRTASKFAAMVPHLENMDPDVLVVISEGRDAGLNHHIRSSDKMYRAIVNARHSYVEFTKDHPGAIVVSATDQCCASALTHASPGDFFDTNGKRKARACKSGEQNCQWNGDEKAVVWQTLMKEAAAKQSAATAAASSDHVYLDASLMAGTAGDLLALLAAVDVDAAVEDERAVLADFMLHHKPDAIILDYEQRIFGKGFDGVQSTRNENCPLVDTSKRHALVELDGANAPMFVYTSRDLGCANNDNAVATSGESFPVWDENGIKFQPVIDHIDVLVEKDTSLVGIDRHFGPEILYIVDEKGLWTSERIQGRIDNETSHFRVKPTEELLLLAHKILLKTKPGSSRWKALQQAVVSEGASGFPYWGFYGDFKACNYHNSAPDGTESVPVLTTCAIAGCDHAFPSPAYMTKIDSQNSTSDWHKVFQKFDKEYPWEEKIRKVVWRGALSENDPTKVFDSARWRLCKKATEMEERGNNHYDVGLVYIPQFLKDQLGEIDVTPVGGLKKGIKPMNDFQRYLAVLDMDGNSWSSRFGTLLCYNSVTVKVEPKYFDYFFYDLEPWKHYVPVKEDLSDLEENIAFIMDPQNEAAVREIIASANQWCAERFVYAELARDVLDIWENYVGRLDRADSNWKQIWANKKGELFAPSSTSGVSNLQVALVK